MQSGGVTLDALLAEAAARLVEAGSPTSRLDAEVLLCHVVGVDRTWLYTWGDRAIDGEAERQFRELLRRREVGEPVAYLTGEREFWGLRLATDPSTLIPRPDTETLVAAALSLSSALSPTLAPAGQGRLLDLGSGSGAIALAFASERPGWRVLGLELRPEAVALARRNAARLALANAEFRESDWFAALADEKDAVRFDLVVSNPPYIAEDDPHLAAGDVRFEPRSALVAGAEGLADLRYLVDAAREHLLPGGWLLLEHGWGQAVAVREALTAAGYAEVASHRDLGGHERVSLGRLPSYVRVKESDDKWGMP